MPFTKHEALRRELINLCKMITRGMALEALVVSVISILVMGTHLAMSISNPETDHTNLMAAVNRFKSQFHFSGPESIRNMTKSICDVTALYLQSSVS